MLSTDFRSYAPILIKKWLWFSVEWVIICFDLLGIEFIPVKSEPFDLNCLEHYLCAKIISHSICRAGWSLYRLFWRRIKEGWEQKKSRRSHRWWKILNILLLTEKMTKWVPFSWSSICLMYFCTLLFPSLFELESLFYKFYDWVTKHHFPPQ